MKIQFTKMNGIGNDFILIDDRDEKIAKKMSYKNLAKKLCRRRYSIGADGLIIALNSNIYDLKFKVFNSDGSEAEMCGNGIRCFARFVFDKKITNKKDLSIETLAGKIKTKLLDNGQVTVNMGKPIFDPKKIPVLSSKKEIFDETLIIDKGKFKFSSVSFGNPHCVLFVKSLNTIAFEKLGSKIEVHKNFPLKTNVEFAELSSKNKINVLVWERGVGKTLACGTGACAVFSVAHKKGLIDNKATINLLGGSLKISLNKNTNEVFMTGAAEYSFDGELTL